jgi:hypothetical protein
MTIFDRMLGIERIRRYRYAVAQENVAVITPLDTPLQLEELGMHFLGFR